MIIREMKVQDVPEVAALEAVCFSDPWSVQSIASEVNNRLSLWLVAEIDGCIAGYVGSQTVLDMTDMMNIAVAPEFRRQGVAEALVNVLVSCLKEKDVMGLLLEVRVSNTAAIALYNKLGFLQVGRRPAYYRNPKEDALILRKELTK